MAKTTKYTELYNGLIHDLREEAFCSSFDELTDAVCEIGNMDNPSNELLLARDIYKQEMELRIKACLYHMV